MDNAEDATIRAAIQQELGVAANAIPVRLVRRLRHQMFSGDLTQFAHAVDYGIQPAGALRNQTAGSNPTVHVHHLIERRFAGVMEQRESQMLSIVLTPGEHQRFTNLWHDKIGYDGGASQITTSSATRAHVMNAAREIYADYPDILRALGL